MRGQVIHTRGSSRGQVRIVGAVPSSTKLSATAVKVLRRQSEARRELQQEVAAAKKG